MVKRIKYVVLISSDMPECVDIDDDGDEIDLDDISFNVGGVFSTGSEALREADSFANGRTNMEVLVVKVVSRQQGVFLSKASRKARR